MANFNLMKSLIFREKRNFPRKGAGNKGKAIFVLFVLSLLFFLLAKFIPQSEAEEEIQVMRQASEIMKNAMDVLREYQRERGIFLDEKTDPNQTGLIGLKFSPITTSLGNLEAKRTTTNPNMAGGVVYLLKQAGVEKGETVAVGASSSFPALIVAVSAASKAMNLRLLVISSLGASQWGANRTDFHWLRMQQCLKEQGVLDIEPIALSLGGESDRGEDMSAEGRSLLEEEIRKDGIFFLEEPNLEKNVELRMRLYEEKAANLEIKAFINIGGSWSNMGTDSEVLKLKPGLNRIQRLPSPEKRGVIHGMAARGVPVIHLLHVKGLVRRYGLPWDPSPLPTPGEGEIYQMIRQKQPTFIFLAALYLCLVLMVMIFIHKFKKK